MSVHPNQVICFPPPRIVKFQVYFDLSILRHIFVFQSYPILISEKIFFTSLEKNKPIDAY